jgi:hypothetical protein
LAEAICTLPLNVPVVAVRLVTVALPLEMVTALMVGAVMVGLASVTLLNVVMVSPNWTAVFPIVIVVAKLLSRYDNGMEPLDAANV